MADRVILPCSPAAFAGLSADILRLGKTLCFKARGSSMQPLVRDGDHLKVEPVSAIRVRTGDIVLCRPYQDHIVVHRVVRRQSNPGGSSFLVQGDRAFRPDGWIDQAHIYGRVTAIVRDGVPIDMRKPAARLLGWVAVQRARWYIGQGRSFRFALGFARRLPVFYRYLV